jgi:hypothetical protein
VVEEGDYRWTGKTIYTSQISYMVLWEMELGRADGAVKGAEV